MTSDAEVCDLRRVVRGQQHLSRKPQNVAVLVSCLVVKHKITAHRGGACIVGLQVTVEQRIRFAGMAEMHPSHNVDGDTKHRKAPSQRRAVF